MAHQTLSKYETSFIKGDVEKRAFMQSVYEAEGVIFTQGGGVEPDGSGILELKGREGFAWFRNDVLSVVQKGQADICVSNVDEREFDKWGTGGVNENYRTRMAEIVKAQPEMRARFLIKKGDTHLAAKNHSEYRAIPEKDFGDFPLYLYGNKTAIMLFDEDDVEIIILNHAKITRSYRKAFYERWANAEPV